jgi:EAL domain-containing protein (putative c-di-GMP-specific phosphodiesterase class I)
VITSAILQLSRALQLTVVAEGVEELEQMQELIDLGCSGMQGFLFSVPLTPDEMGSMLRDPDSLASALTAIPMQRRSEADRAAPAAP